MKYFITITTIDGEGNPNTVTDFTTATDARAAHDNAAALAYDPANAVIRVYPDTTTDAGLARGALMVARRTAVNAVKRGGSETQWRIEREFAAINSRCRGAETADRVISVIREYSHDTQEFFGYASAGLCEALAAGLDIPEQYHNAFKALNKYISSERKATEYEMSTEFITDGGGDVVALGTAIASIIKGGDKWTPRAGGKLDKATAARLGKALTAAAATLTPIQRDILRDMTIGYSQRDIAARRNRSLSTVAEHIANIRKKVTAYVKDNAPEFLAMTAAAAIKQEAVNIARTANKVKGAEYYREYRARKKQG